MDFAWVRTLRDDGGKSRWHLLVDRRRGTLYRGSVASEFVLAACGEAYDPPIETPPGVQPDLWNAGVLVPATSRPQHINTQVCQTCRQVAWRLTHSTCLERETHDRH